MTIDRLDYHWDAAEEAGQPGEQGFVHIACFLAWVFAHRLHARHQWPSGFVRRATTGSATLQEYIDAADEKLLDAELTAEGRKFAAHAYDGYLTAYDAAFPDVPDYAVPFDAATRSITAAILDDRYADWVASGRPEPEARVETDELTADELAELDAQVEQAMERLIVIPEGATDDEIETLLDGIDGAYSTVTLPRGWTERDLLRLYQTPHERPDLEARLPPTVGGAAPLLYSEAGSDPPPQRMVDILREPVAQAGLDPDGLGFARGTYPIEGRDEGDCFVMDLWSLPGPPTSSLAAVVRDSIRSGRRSLAWTERTDRGVRAWTAQVRRPVPLTLTVLAADDVVVSMADSEQACIDEAIAWFRDHPGPDEGS